MVGQSPANRHPGTDGGEMGLLGIYVLFVGVGCVLWAALAAKFGQRPTFLLAGVSIGWLARYSNAGRLRPFYHPVQ